MKKKLLLSLILSLVSFSLAWADKSTREQVNIDESVGAGYTLQPGKMYIVRSNMTLEATSGSGLNVAPLSSGQQAPILYIPADVTVTVKGANANGRSGAGAGIYVPSGAELIITGAGTLVATGGNAANGGKGEDGHNAGDKELTKDLQQVDFDLVFSGAGGAGGYGGGGAGAGIGGIGGQGGAGGLGGAAKYFKVGDETKRKSGEDGKDGENGSAGVAMGKVYVTGTVTVTATAGSVGTAGGAGGTQGNSAYHEYDDAWNVAGAGGGGAGGGAGYAAPYSIGAGGRGAGGGAGGGSGSVDWNLNTALNKPTKNNSSGRASSATGVGKGVQNGTAGDNYRTRDTGYAGLGLYQETGGEGSNKGGEAGAVATTADNGSLYVGNDATVNGQKGSKPSGYSGTTGSAPTDMQITITFKNNEFKNDGTTASDVTVGDPIVATIGEPLPDAAVSPYQLSATSKYFAGYYSADKGLGTRIYKGTGTGNLDKAVNAVPFSKDVTLYAHFSHNQHNVTWDYTYQQIDESGYADVAADDRVKRARLTLYFREGTPVSRILTAANATRPGDSSPAENSHLVSTSTITLNPTSSDNLTGNDINIMLTDDQLAQFTSYTFEALNNDAETVPTNWLVYTNKETHATTVSFTGATEDKCFDLEWEVKLTGLKVYPEAIFVKPMFAEPEGSDYDIISQLADNGNIHYDGVQCAWTAKPADDATSCTYTGSYPVWKYKTETSSYKNKIGLVGFILGGNKYYMDGTPGNVHSDMLSLDEYNSENNICTYTEGQTPLVVKMDVNASVIPVLRLMPNGAGASLAQGTLPIYVNESRNPNISLNGYRAVRPGYVQTGWEDSEGTSYALDAPSVPGTGALTLYAQWKENVPPVITTQNISYEENKAVVTIKATDNVGVTSVQYIMRATPLDDYQTQETVEWTSVSISGDNLYNFDITLPRAYLYLKATDAAGNTAYEQSGEIVSDGIAPSVEVYPTGNVCNFPVTITATDNYQVAKIEVKKGSSDYVAVYEYTSGTIFKNQEYSVAKLASATGEPVTISVRVTDGAGKVTTLENVSNMYHSHAWNETKAHTVKQKDSGGNIKTYTYYECDHGCGHVWVEEWTVGDTTFGKPNKPEDGKSGYSQDSELSTDEEKNYQQQGLMREKTDQLFDNTGSVEITDQNGKTIAVTHTLNDAITEAAKSEKNVITLYDNANVGESSETSFPAANTLDNPVTIDLNGHGLKVAGEDAPGDGITGNAKVTILLKDDGVTAYTNKSQVTGSPIKYHRTFAASTRAGNWQALYLPFAAGAVSAPQDVTYTFGTPSNVSITAEKAVLEITKDPESLSEYTHYFVKSSNGEVEINVAAGDAELKAADDVASHTSTISANYTFKGSLTDTDNAATAEQSYWVLTNGGHFVEAAASSHQRPYHWVIYNNNSSGGSNFRSLTIVEVESNPSAIESVADETILSGEIYSISGQRMPANATLPAGLYVRNGKKFSVK